MKKLVALVVLVAFTSLAFAQAQPQKKAEATKAAVEKKVAEKKVEAAKPVAEKKVKAAKKVAA